MMKKHSKVNAKGDFWLKLDNAAKIYPAIVDHELTSVFRVSVVLKERVKVQAFLEAVQAIEQRFPYYKVKMKAGFFWYYLEPENIPISFGFDSDLPCRVFHKGELMFRILVNECTISVEFSHILTDGTGALEFLKTFLINYLDKRGVPIPSEFSPYISEKEPATEEYEDAYKRYFKKTRAKRFKFANAFHIPFPLRSKPRFDVLSAIMPVDTVIRQAKVYDVSLSEYLIAVYLYALQEIYEGLSPFRKRISKKILRIQVPVNLRQLFPTQTRRNFSLYVLPEIDLNLGHYTFEEIIKIVYHQMRLQTDEKLISKNIARNVGGERNPFIRTVPLFMKSLLLSTIYNQGAKQFSGVLSNLGRIDMGEAINAYIDEFMFIPPPSNKMLKVNCAVVGFENKLIVTFGSICTSKELERHYLKFLTKAGIPVALASKN